jgi:hypothetical protein
VKYAAIANAPAIAFFCADWAAIAAATLPKSTSRKIS